MLAGTSNNSLKIGNHISMIDPTSSMCYDVVDNVNAPNNLAHLVVLLCEMFTNVYKCIHDYTYK